MSSAPGVAQQSPAAAARAAGGGAGGVVRPTPAMAGCGAAAAVGGGLPMPLAAMHLPGMPPPPRPPAAAAAAAGASTISSGGTDGLDSARHQLQMQHALLAEKAAALDRQMYALQLQREATARVDAMAAAQAGAHAGMGAAAAAAVAAAAGLLPPASSLHHPHHPLHAAAMYGAAAAAVSGGGGGTAAGRGGGGGGPSAPPHQGGGPAPSPSLLGLLPHDLLGLGGARARAAGLTHHPALAPPSGGGTAAAAALGLGLGVGAGVGAGAAAAHPLGQEMLALRQAQLLGHPHPGGGLPPLVGGGRGAGQNPVLGGMGMGMGGGGGGGGGAGGQGSSLSFLAAIAEAEAGPRRGGGAARDGGGGGAAAAVAATAAAALARRARQLKKDEAKALEAEALTPPRRPLTPYNLFFKYQRLVLLNSTTSSGGPKDGEAEAGEGEGDGGARDGPTNDGGEGSAAPPPPEDGPSSSSSSSPPSGGATGAPPSTPESAVAVQVDAASASPKARLPSAEEFFSSGAHLADREWRKRRPHRKSHGKISFTGLVRAISAKWKALPDSKRALYQDYSRRDYARYRQEMSEYKAKKKILQDGRMQALSLAA